MRRTGGWRVVGASVLAALAVLPATATAAPFRVTLPHPQTGTFFDRLPTWTFAADALPAGFTAIALAPPARGVVLLHPSQVGVEIDALGSPDIFPVGDPLTRIAPDGATVAADGSWTLEDTQYRFGRFADGSGRKIWLQATIFVSGGDIGSASPEQLAAIAGAKAALQPSLRVWYGLDPRTTSDGERVAVMAKVSAALRRTAALRDWSATVDEAADAHRPGLQKTHAVYALRERRGHIAVSYVEARPPGVRRLHRPGRSWQYNKPRGCWVASPDRGPSPIPIRERMLVRYGPTSISLIGNGGPGYTSNLFADPRPMRLAYDVTAKAPLSLGSRGTRYELYVYQGFRVHLVVDVNRHGIATVIKEEQLDASGLPVEHERIGIVSPAPRKLLTPGRLCR